jgi:Plastocyanin-like domain
MFNNVIQVQNFHVSVMIYELIFIAVFNYTSNHDVAEVTKDDYTSCSTSNELTYDNSSTTIVELTTAGTRYFICAVPTHCSGGMKVKIDVLAKPNSPPTSSASALPPASQPPATSPAHSPVNANKAAVAQHGVGVLVLGLIGLMLAMS